MDALITIGENFLFKESPTVRAEVGFYIITYAAHRFVSSSRVFDIMVVTVTLQLTFRDSFLDLEFY